jgi:RimJ/RimL family protein N-acetyltransferase
MMMLPAEFTDNPVWLPVLETPRLVIRPFLLQDLADAYRILDVETAQEPRTLAERETWLRWTIAGYTEYARLLQFPYGDRAVILRESGDLVGIIGFVPCLDSFSQIPGLMPNEDPSNIMPQPSTAEVGLFWAVTPLHQQRGIASEAASALVGYAFSHFHLRRLIATTAHDNVASIGVMRKLVMRIERNPFEEPTWLQVVGILENTDNNPTEKG